MITKKRIKELIANHDFGDFISIENLIRFTKDNYEELGFEFCWVDDDGLWAIAFNNKSKALKYGSIVFDYGVKFYAGTYDEKYSELADKLLEFAKRAKYYNKLKVLEKMPKRQITIRDNRVLADYMIRRFVDVISDYKDIEFNQKSALIARVQNLKIK